MHHADLHGFAGRRREAVTASAIGSLGDYIDLTIDKGTGTVPFGAGCAGYTNVGNVYTGELDDFATAHSSFANGLVVNPGAADEWVQNDAVVFRTRSPCRTTTLANGGAIPLSTGAHSWTWQARNN